MTPILIKDFGAPLVVDVEPAVFFVDEPHAATSSPAMATAAKPRLLRVGLIMTEYPPGLFHRTMRRLCGTASRR